MGFWASNIGLEDNMALPQTEHPLIDVHIHSLNKSVKFRPFLVKEEKLLVLASESKDQEEMVKAYPTGNNQLFFW